MVSQIDRLRAKARAPLLDTRPKEKDDMKIPFVLTYHPAMHKVYEILRKNQNLLLVDKEHETVFKDKIFVTFRRAKSLKDKLLRAKLQSIDEELMEKGTFRCNGRRSCQICPLMREGDTFHNFDSTRSFKISRGGTTATRIMLFTCYSVSLAKRNMLEVQKPNFGKWFNVYKSYFRTYARKYNENSLDKGKLVPQASIFNLFLKTDTGAVSEWGLKSYMG